MLSKRKNNNDSDKTDLGKLRDNTTKRSRWLLPTPSPSGSNDYGFLQDSQVEDTFSSRHLTTTSNNESEETNWMYCFFCQTVTSERLVKPSQGYDSAANNLIEFHKIGKLSSVMPRLTKESLVLKSFTCKEDLKKVFQRNEALWHISCYLKCNNNKLQRAQLRVEKQKGVEDLETTTETKRYLRVTSYKSETCLFCDLHGTKDQPLIKIVKKSRSDSILEYANKLKDNKILIKVSECLDLTELGVKYHHKCFNEYEYRFKKSVSLDNSTISSRQVESITFTQLVTHINEAHETDGITVFKVIDLARFQSEAMKNLGVHCSVHTTRLKEKLLRECPYLTASDNNIGKPCVLTFKNDVDFGLRSLETNNYDSEKTALCNAANILRSDIFDNKNYNSHNVPASVVTLVSMILYGPDNTCDDKNDCVSLCLAELLYYNAVLKKTSTGRRHFQAKEAPTPVYVAAKLYGETRQKKLIQIAHCMGLSISYDRLQAILTEKANNVCELHHQTQVVCPPKLLKDLFTTAAVDNIDHNPNTAKSSFHGTAITIMQHQFSNEAGSKRDLTPLQTITETIPTVNKKLKQLPLDYTVVPPCFVDIKKSICPQSEKYMHEASVNPFAGEKDWLERTMSNDPKLWAAYHAQNDKKIDQRHSTTVALMPLFKEQSHTPAMMLHTMHIVENAIKFLNPTQIPVLVADQPLYALLKQLQYLYPSKVGDDKFFVMMGGLHIEMAALKLIGQLLNGSGWVEVLVQANISTPGRCESLITASNVIRTRYAHQVTAAALFSMQKKAYKSDLNEGESEAGPTITFEDWKTKKNAEVPQFKFWDLALNLELIILQFIRSIRSGNYKLYVDSIRALLPWFFALDHIHYSRWLSVHHRDLVNLEKIQPDLFKHFESGKFVARKTNKPYSGIALDQAHEQVNAFLKGRGGMIGLTESPDSLQKWLLAGPELADLTDEYEKGIINKPEPGTDDTGCHHSDTRGELNRFISDVRSLESAMNNLGSPFLEEDAELYNIDTKAVTSSEVINTIKNIEKLGEEQYMNFCQERLVAGRNLHEAIKLNKFTLFYASVKKTDNKTKAKIRGLKNDCSLFSKLYIATCEHRTGDLDSFFTHENQNTPPSLSDMGRLRSGSKADLLKIFANLSGEPTISTAPPVSAKILDGSAIVHMLNPGNSRTFLEYADTVFVGFLRKELENISRLDVVWDRYDLNSLKTSTREKRGIGSRTRVTASTKIPKGWANFLRDGCNKEELFGLLTSRVHFHSAEFAADRNIYITDSDKIRSNCNMDFQNIQPCNHEEADTRMMVHVADCVSQGFSKIMLRSVDTDVVVLAVACMPKLPQVEELWVHLGVGKNHQFISCHGIAASLGPNKALVLPMFHAFTGCDTTSFFHGKGKKTAFETWITCPSATEGFQLAMDGEVDRAFPILETFVIAMYDKSASSNNIDLCRKHLFTKKDRAIENLPPTKDALFQHLLRASYQGGQVWGQLLKPRQDLPCPSQWGWVKNDMWKPVWTTLPVASNACIELIRCRCKVNCTKRCNCVKRDMKCTELCRCGGTCQQIQ